MYETRGGLCLVLRDSDGHCGLAMVPEPTKVKPRTISEWFRQNMLGAVESEIEPIRSRLFASEAQLNTSHKRLLCAGIELALLDLIGVARDRTASSLLGGAPRLSIPLYLSTSARKQAPEPELERIRAAIERHGFRAVKFKIGRGGHRGDDAELPARRPEVLLPLARRVLGDNVSIMVDANGTYGHERAAEIARILAAHDVAWFEEPVPWQRIDLLQKLSARSGVALAWGEHAQTKTKVNEALDISAVSVLQPDLWRFGGTGMLRSIAATANDRGRETIIHHPGTPMGYVYTALMVSIIADPGRFQEYRYGVDASGEWFEPPARIEAGELQAPIAAGLGYGIERERIISALRAQGRQLFLERARNRVTVSMQRAAKRFLR